MPKRSCTVSTCAEFARPNSSRCDEHAKEYERLRSARRRAATKGVYKTRRWEALRHRVLAEQFLCAECVREGKGVPRAAVEVDHIVPLSDGGEPYARGNVQGLCRPHHWRKTAAEVRRRRGGPRRA